MILTMVNTTIAINHHAFKSPVLCSMMVANPRTAKHDAAKLVSNLILPVYLCWRNRLLKKTTTKKEMTMKATKNPPVTSFAYLNKYITSCPASVPFKLG
jgi:hypothetical protein